MAVEYICVVNINIFWCITAKHSTDMLSFNCYPTYDVNVDNSIIRMTEEAYPVPY